MIVVDLSLNSEIAKVHKAQELGKEAIAPRLDLAHDQDTRATEMRVIAKEVADEVGSKAVVVVGVARGEVLGVDVVVVAEAVEVARTVQQPQHPQTPSPPQRQRQRPQCLPETKHDYYHPHQVLISKTHGLQRLYGVEELAPLSCYDPDCVIISYS